jgi:hypothetical protein
MLTYVILCKLDLTNDPIQTLNVNKCDPMQTVDVNMCYVWCGNDSDGSCSKLLGLLIFLEWTYIGRITWGHWKRPLLSMETQTTAPMLVGESWK